MPSMKPTDPIADHAIHETHRPTPSLITWKEERKDREEVEKEERGWDSWVWDEKKEKAEREGEKKNILMEKGERS